MKIGFIGLGKLGLPCALAVESRGHKVCGYDPNPLIKKYFDEMKIPYREEGVEELLQETKIEVKDLFDVLVESDISFVSIQTPHDPRYEGTLPLPKERVDFDYSYLVAGMKDIISEIVEYNSLASSSGVKPKDFVISIISTVLPGTMYREIFPLIPAGITNIHVVYNPFFIAMGTTIQDFLYPEFVLLGVDDKYAAETVEDFYNETLPSNPDKNFQVPRVFKCSINTAETVKVLYNTYITQKICFANAAMELCEKTNADVDDLIDALLLGTRRIVSGSYMRAGMGDGGGCHPRDNIALSHISQKLNISYDWWENLMVAREEQTKWLASLIATRVYEIERNGRKIEVMILGYTFKPETNLIVGSPALLLKNVLETIWAIKPIMYDPFIDDSYTIHGSQQFVESVDDLYKIYCEPRIFFIGTKHEVFKNYIFPESSIVIDPFRYMPDQDGIFIHRIGQAKHNL